MSEFPIKKKTHRARLKIYYSRKKKYCMGIQKSNFRLKTDNSSHFFLCRNLRHISPTNRPCANESGKARKYPTKMKTPKSGDLGQDLKSEMQNSKRRLSGIFDGSKNKQEKAAGLYPSLRFTSDGNADRRTAWLRRFSEICTVAAIRGCRCTCFRLWC